MTTIAHLSPTYAVARDAFLAAATAARARLQTFDHPLKGPDGEDLAVDVAEFGPLDATNVVLVVSATHGVEGFCGSALQRHWLEHHVSERPSSVRLVMIHALNPFGFAWVRRVNEDNVDLNRNFIDWTQPAPANDEYDRIADLIVPADFSEASQASTVAALLALANDIGLDRMQSIVSSGQYSNPKGVFYGGAGPVWSHQWLRAWATDALCEAKRLTIIDLHTGLGEWGHGELIGSETPDDPAHQRAAALWGDVRSMLGGDSVSAALTGDWLAIAQELAPGAERTAMALEYGTLDPISVLLALRADAWLHGYGDPAGPQAAVIRAQVRAAFADDNPEWIRLLWPRFAEVLGLALNSPGLPGAAPGGNQSSN